MSNLALELPAAPPRFVPRSVTTFQGLSEVGWSEFVMVLSW